MKISVGEVGFMKKNKKDAALVAEGCGGGGGGPGGRVETAEQEKGGERNNAEEEGAGKTLVVGVRMDTRSRELLTWALVNVAATGDRVVALHVLTSSGSPAAVLALSEEFDNMLAAYEGFCNLKQIDLKLKLCKGSSIRKVLVLEAKAFTASKLILGVAKNSGTVGPSWISIAKHCAKKLPSNCSVLALSNGKIAFQREATANPEARKGLRKDSAKNVVRNLQSFTHMVGQEGRSGQDSSPSIVSNNESTDGGISIVEYVSSKSDASLKDCAMYSTEDGPPSMNELIDNESISLVSTKVSKSSSVNSSSKVNKELPKTLSGRLSLRNLVSTSQKNVSSESLKTSSFHWSMRLPHRHSSVHPDHKSAKLDTNEILNSDGGDKTNGSYLHLPSFHLKDANGKLLEDLESIKENYSFICRMFSYEELMHATSNFSPGKLIGKGGSSSVYKGCLSDGKKLAAKIVKPSVDAVKEFVSEIKIATSLKHKNIISILGFCLDTNNLILVYDYISRGSLEEILHGEKVHKYLSWSERYKVAVGVAEALVYLHGGGSKEPIIHRDVKSSNILISDDYEPQLSDFGLAKCASAAASELASAGAAGTFGYLAPEFFQYGKVSEKTDVYAFGVVLLELLSRRKPITIDCPKGQESLVMWAKPFLLRGEVKELLDPKLRDEYDGDQVERMSLAASLCTRALHQARPKMSHVLKLLGGDDDVVKWARTEVSAPEVIGLDEELPNLKSNIQSHLSLALLDVDDEGLSTGSIDNSVDTMSVSSSVEDYLQCRWSRSSSFD